VWKLLYLPESRVRPKHLLPDDLDGYTQLVRRSPIPIAGGEHEYVVSGFRELLDRQAHSILPPDARRAAD
jgi:L-alanine-DL-glutamate epimerase-like enolase superfamily enzyme